MKYIVDNIFKYPKLWIHDWNRSRYNYIYLIVSSSSKKEKWNCIYVDNDVNKLLLFIEYSSYQQQGYNQYSQPPPTTGQDTSYPPPSTGGGSYNQYSQPPPNTGGSYGSYGNVYTGSGQDYNQSPGQGSYGQNSYSGGSNSGNSGSGGYGGGSYGHGGSSNNSNSGGGYSRSNSGGGYGGGNNLRIDMEKNWIFFFGFIFLK